MMSQLLALLMCAGLASAGCPSIPSGWVENDGYCYWLSDFDVDQWRARETCESYGSDITLASIHSFVGNAFIWETIMQSSGNVWIGLEDRAHEDTFVWLDGTPLDFVNWEDKQPDDHFGQDCVRMPHPDHKSNAKWDDADCSDQHNFICMTPATA